MKDIYELLNDVEIDENEFVEMDVSAWEKARMKNKLKKSIRKKGKSWRRNLAAASILVVLSTATLGLTLPAYAGSIPLIGDIFRFIDNGRTGLYDEYKKYSSEMNMMEESNGTKIMINDAVYDGRTVTVTFSIETEQNLGEEPFLDDILDIQGAEGLAGTSKISKVDDNQYVGLVTSSDLDREEKDQVKVNWKVDGIKSQDDRTEIKGRWNFAFALPATENTAQISNRSSEKNGVKVTIGKVTYTPMSFIVYYDQLDSKSLREKGQEGFVDIEVKDNLGNLYSGQINGGSGDSERLTSWSKTFNKLDPNATKLIITPHVELFEHITVNSNKARMTVSTVIPASTEPGKGRKITELDDIIIDIKK